MKRKIFTLALLLLMSPCFIVIILSSSNHNVYANGADKCEHEYSIDWSLSATYHCRKCLLCGAEKDRAEHKFTNACDTNCSICGYIRRTEHSYSESLKYDKLSHWLECVSCGGKADIEMHTPGAPPTEFKPQSCTECGYIILPALGHDHAFDKEWQSDDTTHYRYCHCGERSDIGEHIWNVGEIAKEPTESSPGLVRYTCTVCEKTKVETLYAPSYENGDGDVSEGDQDDSKNENVGDASNDKNIVNADSASGSNEVLKHSRITSAISIIALVVSIVNTAALVILVFNSFKSKN